MIEIVAPAKIIIFGEHFIVSKGSQAILTTVGLNTSCSISNGEDSNFKVIFSSATFNLNVKFTQSDAISTYSKAKELLDQYQRTQIIKPLKDFIKNQGNFFKALIGSLLNDYSISPSTIKFECDAPLGSGMGTSASIAGAMISALLKENGINFTKQRLYELTKTVEDLQHGSSSGADPAAIINGGLLHYEHKSDGTRLFNNISDKTGWDKDLYLVHTANPIESTGEMVAISNQFKTNYPERFEKLLKKANKICYEFINDPKPNMYKLINENGLMLEELGVVSDNVIEFSKNIRDLGGSIKVAGAGGRSGKGSGICLVIFENKEKLISIINQYKFKLLNAPLMVAGIKI